MQLLRVSLTKLVRRPATWVVLLILLALLTLVFLGLAASVGQLQDAGEEVQLELILGFPAAYKAVVGIIITFGGLLAIVYAASIIGAEWAWGTIRAVVARGESRIRFTLVTYLAIAIVIGVGVLVAFGVGTAMALLAAGMAGFDTGPALEFETLAGLPELVARAWLGVSEQAAIGFAIAMLFRSQLAGIGAGLAVYFGEIFLALVPIVGDVLPYFPMSVATAVVSSTGGLGVEGARPATQLDSGTAVLLAGGYLGVALLVATLAAWQAQITR